MSRDGFARADLDTGYLDDPKWRRLWRSLHDERTMACAVVLHLSTVLASWRQGERVHVLDAAPVWVDVDPAVLAALADACLLDAEGCVPEESWQAWFGPALTRRDAAQAAGRTAVTARWERERARKAVGYDRNTTVYDRDTQPAIPTNQPANQDAREAKDDGRADLEAFLHVRYKAPTGPQRDLMDAYCRVFDQTGPERAARLIYANPDDPIGALKADLAAFRAERKAEAEKQEAPKPAPSRPARGLTGINAELAAILKREYEEGVA